SGWLTAVFGRRRFYLICTVTFTASSFLSGIAPNLEFLILMRILQGLGGGPVVPMSQAVMWEIFPLEQRGTAMAVWGTGIMLAPILGPTVGGYIADNWSWRWIFYISLPTGILAFFMVSAFLFDAPFHRRPRHVDLAGIVLMVVGFGCLQLVLDLGERRDWFDSSLVLMCGVLAACMLAGFVIRELMAAEPILDLTVFSDRNFSIGTLAIFLVGLGFNSSLLLLALYTQTVLGYDPCAARLALAPGPPERLGNSTAAYNVALNIGGSMGVALMTTLLARRSQVHQATLTGHLDPWSFEMAERLRVWTNHFVNHGADTYTAGRQAM